MENTIGLTQLGSFLDSGREYGWMLVQVLTILVSGYVLSRWISRRFKGMLIKVPQVDETLLIFFSTAIHYLLMILTIVVCLGRIGVQTTSIITVLGAAGLAVGLALQGTLSNIASGIMILILRPFKIGEYIEASETKGTVEAIGLFATQLKDLDGLYVMAPNSLLWSRTIRNFSRNGVRRVVIPIGISYKDDITKTQSIILEELARDSSILPEPQPQVLVDCLDSSSVNLLVRFWVQRTDYVAIKSHQLQNLKQLMDHHKIAIPFPQREITILKGE